MPLLTTCPQCQQKYNLRDEYAGQQVRCPKCSAVFLAPAANPFQDPLAPVPSESATLPPTTPISPGGHYLPTGAWVAGGSSGQPPAESGPTDVQFRIGGAAMAGIGLFLAVATYFMHVYQNQIFLLAVVLIPPAIIMGLTTLIHPDITRSVGKWGKHLPWHLRAIGWTLMSVSLVLGLALLILILSTGDYRPG